MKLVHRAGFERAKLLLVDQMIADQAVARAVAKLDVEREGLEQLITFERGVEVVARPVALVEFVEPANDAFEIGRRPAVLIERAKPFLIGTGDALVREVDMDFGRSFALGAADQERLDRESER